jgi:hypothetical protein
MKQKIESEMGTLAALAAALLVAVSASSNVQAATPELKSAIGSLEYFLGNWECSGTFDSSGKTIEAHQEFAPELGGSWMSFRHDDKAPFNYHALAQWGWDPKQKQFVMTAQDSAGGVRVFYSSGWSSALLQWDGDALGSTSIPTQRFSFERLDDRHFRVSYFTLKNGGWLRVDSSTCSKQ